LQAWILPIGTLMTSLCLIPPWRSMVITCKMFLNVWWCTGWNYTQENLGFSNPKWSIWATWFTHGVWESKRPKWIWFPRFIDKLMLVGWGHFLGWQINTSGLSKGWKAKAKYNSHKGECLTIVWVMVIFWCYLFSSPIHLGDDHQPLKWLMESN